MDDLLIRRNPCRIKGAGQDKADERPTLTIDQVFAVADAIQPRYRLLVLLGALTSLRFVEFAALRRRDVDPDGGELRVRRSQAELKHGRTIIKDPKSQAGIRSVAIPDVVLADLRDHLDRFSEAGPNGLVFVGPNGADYGDATSTGCGSKHSRSQGGGRGRALSRPAPHRVTPSTGASTKELMARMGHSSMRAALIYQHASRSRDKQIADAISHNVRDARRMGHARGTPEDVAG